MSAILPENFTRCLKYNSPREHPIQKCEFLVLEGNLMEMYFIRWFFFLSIANQNEFCDHIYRCQTFFKGEWDYRVGIINNMLEKASVFSLRWTGYRVQS